FPYTTLFRSRADEDHVKGQEFQGKKNGENDLDFGFDLHEAAISRGTQLYLLCSPLAIYGPRGKRQSGANWMQYPGASAISMRIGLILRLNLSKSRIICGFSLSSGLDLDTTPTYPTKRGIGDLTTTMRVPVGKTGIKVIRELTTWEFRLTPASAMSMRMAWMGVIGSTVPGRGEIAEMY